MRIGPEDSIGCDVDGVTTCTNGMGSFRAFGIRPGASLFSLVVKRDRNVNRGA
jgi:hypothetical protein